MRRSKVMRVDAFDLSLSDISDVSLDDLHTLSLSVGWPHRASDWKTVVDLGQGLMARDAIGRVQGSVMWFPYTARFATIGMLITTPRLQQCGVGQWMMEHALNHLGDRAIGLNATRSARRLHLSLGFTSERIVYHCQGEATMPPERPIPVGAFLRPLHPDEDRAAVVDLDAEAFGAARATVYDQLLPHARGTALMREGRLAAFALCRRFGRGHVIGPVVAHDDMDAIAVMRPLIARLAGHFLRVDSRQKTGPFPEFLVDIGLPVYDTVTSMALRRPWVGTLSADDAPPDGKPLVYALANQALG